MFLLDDQNYQCCRMGCVEVTAVNSMLLERGQRRLDSRRYSILSVDAWLLNEGAAFMPLQRLLTYLFVCGESSGTE